MLKKVWRFFCSVKLTVVLFVLILIPSVVGTIIQQNAPDPSRYAEVYGPLWDRVFRYLGFYDIYHDVRFVCLLVLLGLNTFACTLNRFRPRWRMLGMMMTHFGLLLILIGALSGALFGVKGFMVVSEGETTDKMSVGEATRKMDTVPFQVKLVDFILDMHEEPAHKLIVLDVKTKRQESYNIEEGQSVPLPQPGWVKPASLLGLKPKHTGTLHVKRVLPHATVVSSLSEGPEKTGVAAMEFRLLRGAAEERAFTASRSDTPYVLEGARLGVGYARLAPAESIDEQIKRAVSLPGGGNQLEVAVAGRTEKKSYPADVGSKFDVEGTDYSIEVLRYVPDFVIDTETRQVTSRSQFPNNPALQVRIASPAGTKDQWIFSKFPAAHTVADVPIELTFRRNGRLGDISDYVLVLNHPGDKPVIAHIREGKLVARAEADIGQPVAIEGTGYSFVADKFFDNANMAREVVNRPEGPGRGAIEIAVEHGGSSATSYLWNGTAADVNGYRMLYRQEDRIRDFYSILQILKGGDVVAEKKIEVNDPLRYEGYSLYQSSYDSERLSWSGLQVKKDPGVPLVYGGFTLQIVGMIIIFYINPLLRKRKTPGRDLAEESGDSGDKARKTTGARS